MITLSAKRLIAACVLAFSLARAAGAQVESREGIALQNQILELQHEVQTLRDQAGRGGSAGAYPTQGVTASGNDLVARLLSRVEALEEQVRELRGRVDETQNGLQRQTAELGKRIEDMGFQAQNPQGGAAAGPSPYAPPPPSPYPRPYGPPPTGYYPAQPPGAEPTPQRPPGSSQLGMSAAPGGLGLTPPPAAPQQPPAPVRRTPEMTMQEGYAALSRRDYPLAEQAAREVLSGSRTSPRAYDAQYLLAQALMGQRQYSQAAIAFDDAYNRSRKGAHAQDALVGLANALIAIDEKKAACDTLVRLHADYPAPRADLREAISASTQRAGCR